MDGAYYVDVDDIKCLLEAKKPIDTSPIFNGDPKAMAVSIWNRFFSSFNKHVFDHGLQEDRDQTVEMVSFLLKQGEPLTLSQCSTIAQREYRGLLKSWGFSKVDDRYVRREHDYSPLWWKYLEDKCCDMRFSYKPELS